MNIYYPMVSVDQEYSHGLAGSSVSGSHKTPIKVSTTGAFSNQLEKNSLPGSHVCWRHNVPARWRTSGCQSKVALSSLLHGPLYKAAYNMTASSKPTRESVCHSKTVIYNLIYVMTHT